MNLATKLAIILMETRIIAVAQFAERVKVGDRRKDVSTSRKMTSFIVIIVGGHQNLINGSKKYQVSHSNKWSMRSKKVISG